MKRLIDIQLLNWKHDKHRKPLLLRGARQVGKTFAVRKLGKSFKNYVEVNFEQRPELKAIFETDLVPVRMIRDLISILKQEIIPGETLLFFDEIQQVPKAIIALRYFYEEMPGLHLIAAGSLLDFAIEKVGIPVGRIAYLYMYPLSWLEFLMALGNEKLINTLINHKADTPLGSPLHEHTLNLLSEYLVVGGMPEAVSLWIEEKNALTCIKVHHNILESYRHDFSKYAKEHQVKYLELLFEFALKQISNKFKFSKVPGEYRKRELLPAFDLLVTAGLIHKIYYSSGQGIPLGAEVNLDIFKTIFVDVGLTQTLLGLEASDWFLAPNENYINKGYLLEAFVGQELLAYSNPESKSALYFWQKESRSSQAEIDYLIQKDRQIIPIEVKSAKGSQLKSLRIFLESHPKSEYGMRFSTHDFSVFDGIHSYPLYAIFAAIKFEFSQ